MSTQAIMIPDELPILMKSGLVHWVKKETWEKISEVLATQSGHQFIRMKELGNIVISTAEVEGAYQMQQYEDHCRVKEGQFQCAYRVWHKKFGECTCKQDFMRAEAEKKKREREAEENKPLTPEQVAANQEALTLMSERAALDESPIFRPRFLKGKKDGRSLRMSTVRKWEQEKGRKANLEGLSISENE